jgi:N-carbamoyl-L-amino-acid hydrolase
MRPTAQARVNLDRFMATLDRSSEIGVGREGGLSRLALTDEDKAMRDVFAGWCREAGLHLTIDTMGNMFGRREGAEQLPPVLIGSHLDTQANGGRFDGIVGVLGGLEVMRTLNDLGIQTRRPIEVVNWTNEEGSRYAPPMMSSGVFVGAYEIDWAYGRLADDKTTFGDELERIGYKGATPAGQRDIDSYLELHIEQSDVLDREGKQVGIVNHGHVSHGMIVEYRGETAHAGPWPMERRRNALLAAARLLVAVDDIGWDFAETGGKATAARLAAWPNKAGIISDWAEASCDVRHEDPKVAAVMREQLERAVNEAAAKAGCEAKVLERWSWGGDMFDPAMIDLVRRTTGNLGYTSRDIASQAGHDAYFMSRKCPTAMIFTPCRDGITHNNREFSSEHDLEPGLNVLLHAAVARADRK